MQSSSLNEANSELFDGRIISPFQKAVFIARRLSRHVDIFRTFAELFGETFFLGLSELLSSRELSISFEKRTFIAQRRAHFL